MTKDNSITTTQLAKQLNTTNDVILSVARRCGINKEIKNGVATYWDEEEVSTIIKNIDYNNSQSKQALTALGLKQSLLKVCTTSDLSNMLNTTNDVILSNGKKLFPNKKIEQGKITVWSEKEASEIIKNIGYDSPNASKELMDTKGTIKTSLMIKEEANESLNILKQLEIQEQIKASLLLQQNIIEQLNNHNIKLENKIEQDKPLVDFATNIATSSNNIPIGDYAKIIFKEFKMGQNKLFKFLRDNEFLMNDNMPYQKYLDNDVFTIREGFYNTPYGKKTYTQTLVTGKGQIFLTERIKCLLKN